MTVIEVGTAKSAPGISISIRPEGAGDRRLLGNCRICLFLRVDICSYRAKAVVGETAGTWAWIKALAPNCSHFLHCHKAPAVFFNAASLVEAVGIIFIKSQPLSAHVVFASCMRKREVQIKNSCHFCHLPQGKSHLGKSTGAALLCVLI